METAIRDDSVLREASRLVAADGEICSADAIRLLQIPHSRGDVQNVLRVFEKQLSSEAKSKLTLDALVPPPAGVVNQRYEPFFEKHVVTGRTYVTASGNVVPNELQYYNGEMVHFYGECTNVSAVTAAVAGSGYRPVTLKYADGRQTAIGQLWSSNFTDTSIGPYSAMFIVVVVVPDDAPPTRQACMSADPNGASSALVMLDGSFDPGTGLYENRARLFMVRLLDTTQVAIDVGRERMGTDKRPGIIDMARHGRRLRLSISDQGGRGVVKADLELADNPAAYLPEIAKAAGTAGIPLRALPAGTEYAYPAVARIGQRPVVSWQWRSDVAPRFQAVPPGTVVFDPRSEEGQMLITWGFTPKVLGYIPDVRGVVTGLADPVPSAPINLVMLAERASQAAILNVPLFRAGAAGEPGGVVGQLPVLRLIAQELSSPLGAATPPALRETRPGAGTAISGHPRWNWSTTFLGSLTAFLRKEVIGVTPDGLRINWHVTKGNFVGSGLEASVLPGAADWMRIRRDGIAIVSVQACFQTRDGALVYGSYGGIFDLGPDGFARALRDEYDYLPPVVVTPTYATADPRLEWLNRAQCVGVGRVDMNALRVEFDVYVIRVGDRADHKNNGNTAKPPNSGVQG